MTSDESQSSTDPNGDGTEEENKSQDAQASGETAGESAGEVTGEAPEAQTAEPPRPQRAARGGRTSRAPRGSAAARAADDAIPLEAPPKPRLLDMYRDTIVPAIMEEFGFTNPMRVPKVQKIVLNIGLGEALTNSRAMEGAVGDLTTISGQKPLITRARKSIAGFKIREGNPIGTSVTLRGARMYHFLDRFINMALPRIRDFRGLPRTGFDGRGNFSIGIREQIIFPEIDYNQIDRIRGLQVTIATSARNDEEGIRLLELYGMPFIRLT